MPRPKRKRVSRKKPQKYDTSFKGWVEQQAQDILPLLLPGAVYEKTLTVEIVRSVMRADKVFKILYCGEEHILHLEFETGSDRKLRPRLLVYNAVLYQDYQLPVITIVVYPFNVEPAVSPLSVQSNQKEILTFHFKTLSLSTLEAEQFVQEQRACMYPVLPTMRGVHAELMAQVMEELTELYRDDEGTLSQQYTWMMLLLERTDTVEPLEKDKIEEKLKMYDQLWNESPRVQKMKVQLREQAQKEARQEAEQKAEQKLAQWQKEVERLREQVQKEAKQEAEQKLAQWQKEVEQERTEWQKLMQDLKERSEIEAKARADQEAKLLRRALVSMIHVRFPDLSEFAQQQVEQFDKLDVLDLLIQKIATAPDANIARWLLDSNAEVHE